MRKLISIIVVIILMLNMFFQVKSLAEGVENNNVNTNTNVNNNTNSETNDSNSTNTNTSSNTNTNDNNANTDINEPEKVPASITVSYFLKDGNMEWSLGQKDIINGFIGMQYDIAVDGTICNGLLMSGNYTVIGDTAGVMTEESKSINIYLDLANGNGATNISNKPSIGKDNILLNDVNKEMSSMKNMLNKAQSDLQSANNTISSLSSSTYNGSQNNYLKTLSGVELKNEFKKTNQTYFASVGNDITKLDIKATAEDSNAKVTIYGNTDLQTGMNKILINVTSEDGSIRTYRIYVTKQ